MRITFLSLLLTAITFSQPAHARDQIRIVGSSTVYPFITVVAETFGNNTSFATPIVESTGTGGGFKLLCSGTGDNTADFSNASRAVKQSEIDLCKEHGVNNITEIKLGYDGIVVANSLASERYNLSKKQLFLALGKHVPVDGTLVENPYKKWSDIDPSLPDSEISVYGPPPTSGTRDAFVELVMEEACVDLPAFKTAYPDKKNRQKQCHQMREDGAFVEAGENDNLIIQKLVANPTALGIFGYSFLEQNSNIVQGSLVDHVAPDFDNIADGSYGISRPLYVYMKDVHIKTVPGMQDFLQELVSDAALGDEGYLAFKGLIPLPQNERTALQEKIKKLL